jgi:thiamine kinase-like enzyme
LERPVIGETLDRAESELVIRMADRARSALDQHTLTVRPLHGDAHHGNLWTTERGFIWGDFEDTHAGPVEWDLACLVTSSIVFGSGQAAHAALEAFEATYDQALLNLLVVIRTLQAVGWAFVANPILQSTSG